MALSLVHANPPPDAYLGGLRALTAALSPALLDRDRWGFLTLRDVFGIDETSKLYCGALPESILQSIQAEGRNLLERGDDGFLWGIGYDFSALPEPYKTELKAFFAWRLARPLARSREAHYRRVRLIVFCSELASSADRPGPCLIDYGHPIETGDGNASTPLRTVFEAWLADNGWATPPMAPPSLTRHADGSRAVVAKEYRGGASMPANDLTFTLVALREKLKPLEQRDLILLRDLYPADDITDTPRKAPYIHFYQFQLEWLRGAARSFVLSKIAHRELSPSTLAAYIPRLALLETCLRETHADPRIGHVTQGFIGETFLNWGNARRLAGKNWYADVCNMMQYASGYLSGQGWGDIKIDKRNLRRVEGLWPGGRGYQLKVAERTIPEDVVERMFQKLDALDLTAKRLLILGRYTGMRSLDLHSLDFDCLKDDPDDARFMILTFYQSKVKRWNTKPLLKEDAAHALVIKTIQDQQQDVRRKWGRETTHLFPTRRGDGETHLTGACSRKVINRWIIVQGIHDKDGRPWEFGWHGLRHFYGTELALQGHDIALIQMELGHASADMTMVYINRRLQLKKKALLEKGGGKFIDIKGQVDERMAALAVRKEAALAVDVPGGLCALPGQLGDWCEHNRACMTCIHFRVDADQIAFFDRERGAITRTIARLKQEIAGFRQDGRSRMAEIGERRLAHHEALLVNLSTILTTIQAEGSYRGDTRRYQRPACRSGGEAPPQAPGR